MITAKLLPIFALAIGGLVLLGCGGQRQVPGDLTQVSNRTLSKIDPVSDASDIAAVSPSLPAAEMASPSAQERVTQFVMPNSRQRVLSSGFPARN
ncbi:MAG TPA: hypothetical protein VNE82_25220 [Candidatus Binataceae bacterium]|nr:hypothetical protein [Candidatus Binataceae bacterium]